MSADYLQMIATKTTLALNPTIMFAIKKSNQLAFREVSCLLKGLEDVQLMNELLQRSRGAVMRRDGLCLFVASSGGTMTGPWPARASCTCKMQQRYRPKSRSPPNGIHEGGVWTVVSLIPMLWF